MIQYIAVKPVHGHRTETIDAKNIEIAPTIDHFKLKIQQKCEESYGLVDCILK